MKFTKLHIPDELAAKSNMKGFTMEKLGSVVILAGKNGAGKTRILKLVEQAEKWGRSRMTKQHAHRQLLDLGRNRDVLTKRKDQMDHSLFKSQIKAIDQQIQEVPLMMDVFEGSVEENTGPGRKVIPFTPKKTVLSDPKNYSSAQMEKEYEKAKVVGLVNIESSVLAYIQEITVRHFAATHQGFEGTSEEMDKAIKDFTTLNELVFQFLGVKVTMNSLKREARIFDKPLGTALLSDGQSVLLQLCVAIHAQGGEFGEFILVMDEPENHMHPEVLLRVLDVIVAKIGGGQLWIATHSVHILAHFDPSEIHFVEDGDVSYGGRNPSKVLRSLLGDESEVGRLVNFLSLPEQIAFNLFSQQCLTDPKVLLTGKDDDQVQQIHRLLYEKSTAGQKLRVLDFGMGKGRLLATLAQLSAETGEKLADKLDYFGYDASPLYAKECKQLLIEIYGTDKGRYFNDRSDLNEVIEPGFFDVIIMCNVLHEIDPSYWPDIFASGASIFHRLNKGGSLLIVEDQLIPIGESPHPKGYLVLNPDQMRILFQTNKEKGYQVSYTDDRKRLAAHMIPCADISNVSVETVASAIVSLRDLSADKIRKIRAEGRTEFSAGRLHAFWVQQLANSTLALASLPAKSTAAPLAE